MRWRTHQVASALSGNVAGAEQALSGALGASIHDSSGMPADGYYPIDYVNFDVGPADAGRFNSWGEGEQAVYDEAIPGIPNLDGNTTYVAGEATTYLNVTQAGMYTMVVNSDDGFQVSAGTSNNPTAYILGKYDSTRGSTDTVFYFKVEQPGVYFFRLLWFQGTGGGNVEWFTMNGNGTAALVNGAQTGAIKGYRKRTVAEPVAPVAGGITSVALTSGKVVIDYTGTLKAASTVSGPYTTVDGASSPFSATPSEAQKYFIAE